MSAQNDFSALTQPVTINYEGLIDNLLRKGTPDRVYFMELLFDAEIVQAIDRRFGITAGLDRSDPHFAQKATIAIWRFLGYDYIRTSVEGADLDFTYHKADDTADLSHKEGRNWMAERNGPITSWEEFEKYPWPDLSALRTDELEWYSANLPDDMCIIAHCGAWCEHLCWLMGYESLCYALYDQRDLVEAIHQKLVELEQAKISTLVQFDRAKVIWGSDDMGFKTATMLAPKDMRTFVLSGHKMLSDISHASGRPYILHSCGNRAQIIEELIEDVKLDAIHSFEDTIELVTDAKRLYGDRLSLLGGIDVDFLCRADIGRIRARVRETLDVCMPGGGYALGTGNSVTNYIPVDHFLAMLDEGRRWG